MEYSACRGRSEWDNHDSFRHLESEAVFDYSFKEVLAWQLQHKNKQW